MNQAIEAVLWDMDGTLADTGELHFQTWREALTAAGFDMTREQFTTTFGMNSRRTMRELLGKEISEEFIEQIIIRKEIAYRERLHGNVRLLPGVQTWLEWLHQHNIPQALASSAPAENIDVFMAELSLREYFDEILSGYELPAKPAPDIFLLAADRLSVPPARCLVIEDAIAGVEAARRAGMTCLAVTTTNPREALCYACRVIDTLAEIHPSEIINH
jgi:beta-phosphoglucomutase family hydrolase